MDQEDVVFDEALRILRSTDPFAGISVDVLMAAGDLVMRHCQDSRFTLDDMLRCLDFGGVTAEYGARGLYVRTGRDGIGWGAPNGDICVNRSDWESYLRLTGRLD
jgi:hypothetical protein